MREKNAKRVSSLRLKTALGVLVVAAAFLWVSSFFEQTSSSLVLAEVSQESFWEGESGQDTLPASFSTEVIEPGDAIDLRVDEENRLIGFSLSGEVEEVYEWLCASLEENSWVAIESGWGQGGSFMKEDGLYRWLYVSCVQVGSYTSVVVQYETSGEGG